MGEIRRLTDDLSIIARLDDQPNDVGGLTAAELKNEFDKAGNIIKEYINTKLIPDIHAENISNRQINGLASLTVQDALGELYGKILQITAGIFPQNSLPGDVILDGTIAGSKIIGLDGGVY